MLLCVWGKILPWVLHWLYFYLLLVPCSELAGALWAAKLIDLVLQHPEYTHTEINIFQFMMGSFPSSTGGKCRQLPRLCRNHNRWTHQKWGPMTWWAPETKPPAAHHAHLLPSLPEPTEYSLKPSLRGKTQVEPKPGLMAWVPYLPNSACPEGCIAPQALTYHVDHSVQQISKAL